MPRSAVIAAILIGLMPVPAVAQSGCRVTGPVDVLSSPNGPVIATLPNGAIVSIVSQGRDSQGRMWARVANFQSKTGWISRDTLSCP
jgi:hypothetical protein